MALLPDETKCFEIIVKVDLVLAIFETGTKEFR